MWIMSVTQAMPLGGHARRDEVQVFEICLHTYTGVEIGAGALSGFIRFSVCCGFSMCSVRVGVGVGVFYGFLSLYVFSVFLYRGMGKG